MAGGEGRRAAGLVCAAFLITGSGGAAFAQDAERTDAGAGETAPSGAPADAAPTRPAPAARPAIMFNRWQEDWSALADRAARVEPWDRLKYLPLGPDGRSWLTLGGGLRERVETLDPASFGVGGRDDGWVISRAEVFAQLNTGPLMTFVELQSDFAPGKRTQAPVDVNRLDLEQAFVELSQPLLGGTARLRVGRQQFAFDLQRFVSVRDGPNVRQSFDAVWGDFERGGWKAIAYWTQPVSNMPGVFDDTSTPRNRFYGARVQRRLTPGSTVSAYWSRYIRDGAVFLDARGDERRDVLDLRYAGKSGALDWDLEGMAQRGRVGAKLARAWAIGWRGGYTLARALRPRLGLQVDAASGDQHPGDGRVETFNPLFTNGDYVTLSGYTGYVNLIHLKPSLTLVPARGVGVLTALAAQWRATANDAIYMQPDVPVGGTAGRGGRWTGAYGQIRTDWAVTPNLALALEGTYFAVGRTIREGGGRDGRYLGVQTQFGW